MTSFPWAASTREAPSSRPTVLDQGEMWVMLMHSTMSAESTGQKVLRTSS